MADGPINQSIPIVLPISDAQKAKLYANNNSIRGNGAGCLESALVRNVRLVYQDKLIAVMSDPEVFPHRKEERVCRQFGFGDARHPGIKMILESGDWCLGGDLHVRLRVFFIIWPFF